MRTTSDYGTFVDAVRIAERETYLVPGKRRVEGVVGCAITAGRALAAVLAYAEGLTKGEAEEVVRRLQRKQEHYAAAVFLRAIGTLQGGNDRIRDG